MKYLKAISATGSEENTISFDFPNGTEVKQIVISTRGEGVTFDYEVGKLIGTEEIDSIDFSENEEIRTVLYASGSGVADTLILQFAPGERIPVDMNDEFIVTVIPSDNCYVVVEVITI